MTEFGRAASRLVVVVNDEGQILGGVVLGLGGGDNPPQVGLLPSEGQAIHEVSLPDELLSEKGLDLEALFRYRLDPGSEPRLKRRSKG